MIGRAGPTKRKSLLPSSRKHLLTGSLQPADCLTTRSISSAFSFPVTASRYSRCFWAAVLTTFWRFSTLRRCRRCRMRRLMLAGCGWIGWISAIRATRCGAIRGGWEGFGGWPCPCPRIIRARRLELPRMVTSVAERKHLSSYERING